MESIPKAPTYKNYAFISYSRKDEHEANWLHRALEAFRIPTGLAPSAGGSKPLKHVRPLFRDKTDLEVRPRSFVEQIERELPLSRFLIVVCSPNAAKSSPSGQHYVDWEIRLFIQAHGVDYAREHILPVIVAGDPGSGKPESECLPPALLGLGPDFLKHNFPLLKDLPEGRRERAAAKEQCVIGCVAFLLDVELAAVRDRYQHAQREQMKKYLALAAAVAICLAGLAVWAVLERGRAVKSALETRATLAQADFDEASRRLDDSRDTSLALAYLGNSLSKQSYPPAESRLQDLIIHRSWLVEGETVVPKAGENETVVSSPPLSQAPGQIRLGISPAGKFALLRNSDGRLELVRTTNGQRVGGLAPEPGWRWSGELSEPVLLVFAPDESAVFLVDRSGDTEAFARGNNQARPKVRVRGYATADWRELLRVEHGGDVGHLVCAPDAAFAIYSYSANGAEDWRLILHPLAPGINAWSQDMTKAPSSLLVSPDGRSVAVVDGCTVSIRNPYEGGALRSAPRVLPADIHNLVFSHDARRLAYLTKSPEVGVMNVETGELACEPRRFGERVLGLAFARDDRFLLVQTDKAIRQFALQASPLAPQLIKPESQLVLQQVASDPTGHGLALASKGKDKQGAVELRSAEGGLCAPPSFIDEPANALAFSPDGKQLAVGAGALHGRDGGSLWLFDVPVAAWIQASTKQGEPARKPLIGRRIAVPGGMVRGLRFSSNGRLLLLDIWVSEEKGAKIALMDVATASVWPDFFVQAGLVNDALFSPDGRQLITAGADRSVRIWDLEKRQQLGQEARLSSSPQSIDINPDGTKIIVGAKYGNDRGALLMLSIDGRALWTEPREFMSGVQKVRFSPDGETFAVGFRDNTVVMFDTAIGRPRTDLMEPLPEPLVTQTGWFLKVGIDHPRVEETKLALPVAELNFLSSEGRSILAISRGSPFSKNGVLELRDPVSGRRLGEPELHANAVRGVSAIMAGRYVSWSISGAILSTGPHTMVEADYKSGLLPAVAGALGGWRLNEWRAPELLHTRPGQRPEGLPSHWATLLDWLAAPVEKRMVEPGGAVPLTARLDYLVTNGSLAEYRQVLDLQPDHISAMAEYWFTAAREIAESAFMAPVRDRSREEKKQRQMEWAQFTGDELRERVFACTEAKQLADFWTVELCAKHPKLTRAWQERATFLRLVGRETEAAVALNQALAYGGGDFTTREQGALLKAQQGDFAGAAQDFDALCEMLEKSPPTGDDSLRIIGKAGLSRLNIDTLGRGLGNVERDVRWIVDNLSKALASIPRLSRENGTQLMDVSEKLTDFLARIDAGPGFVVEACNRLLRALDGKAGTTNFDTLKATLIGHRAFGEILRHDTTAALRDLDAAQRLSPELTAALNAWRAHCYAIDGRAAEARALYAPLLELDVEYAGALGKGIALDLQRLRRRGIALPGLEAFQGELAKYMAVQLEAGLTVTVVAPDGQAEKLGIKVGDHLLTYNREPILDQEWFSWERKMETLQNVCERRPVVVSRDGQRLSFEVMAGRLGVGLKAP